MEPAFISRLTMNNIAAELQNCFQNHIKNAKTTKFFLQSAFYTSKGSSCRVLPLYDFLFNPIWTGLCQPEDLMGGGGGGERQNGLPPNLAVSSQKLG